tara:strand:- start:138 stop:404 length:267 start_codon:yes stop_codon:yes gene_type:complete
MYLFSFIILRKNIAPNMIKSISVAISTPFIDAAIITDRKTSQYNNEIKQVKTKVNIEAKNADFLNTRINKKIKMIGRNARKVSIVTQL